MVAIALVTTLISVNGFKQGRVNADGLDFTASTSSAVADGHSTITFTLNEYWWMCQQQYVPASGSPYSIYWTGSVDTVNCASYVRPYTSDAPQNLGSAVATVQPDYFDISVTGSGNTLSANSLVIGTNGVGSTTSFTLSSTVAETKTVQLLSHGGKGGAGVRATATVTFTAPAAAAPSSAAKKSTSTAPAAATSAGATDSSTPPAPVKTDTLEVAGQVIDATKSITLQASQPLVLSGTTVPNGVVTLVIHSTPRTVTVTADANGRWSYTIKDLPAGTHHVTATVTDPTTKLTSPEATLAAFTVQPAKTVSNTANSAVAHKHPVKTPVVTVLLAIIVLAALGYFFFRVYRRRHQPVTEVSR